MAAPEALAELAALRADITEACDAFLSASETALTKLAAARAGDAQALDALEGLLFAILEACAFQDITGQRTTRIEHLLAGAIEAKTPRDSLLNGPQLHGHGLDQQAADALFSGDASCPQRSHV
jgi:hypothetical protein